jgi:hypothetical protein
VVAHGLQLADGAVLGSVGVEAGEVVRPGIVVESTGGSHVPDRGEHGVLHRDVGLLRSAERGDPPVLGAEVTARVLSAGNGGGA